MAGDFTLVIPTYNRPEQLARLLNYLEREQALFPILVLDSSTSQFKSEVKQIAQARAGLSIRYLEFDEAIKPFDKFYEGLCQVETEFSQLCADDDFIIVPAINDCVTELKSNPLASVVHGYYFAFSEREVQGGMDITHILYYSATIGSPQPLHRIKELFNHYQALTYGVYRTSILVKILRSIKSVEQILARELLASALAVVYGTAVRLPVFTHGRSMGPSQTYQYWHPLEWLFRTPQGLFTAYQEYKKTLVAEILSLPTNHDSKESVEKMLDLIHLDYLLCHAPKEAFNFLLEKTLQGEKLDDIWQSQEVQIPLIHAANKTKIINAPQNKGEKNRKSLFTRVMRKLYKTIAGGHSNLPESSIQNTITKRRSYRLHSNFLVPTYCDKQVNAKDITQLTLALDNYY